MATFLEECINAFTHAHSDSESLPASVSERLHSRSASPNSNARLFYYNDLPSQPALVARTSADNTSWPSTYRLTKEMRSVGDHRLREIWEDNVAFRIHELLDAASIQWTSTDVVRIGETGTAFEPPVVLWIGVYPGSLSEKDGLDVAQRCSGILNEHGISDVNIEIRESVVTRWARTGPKLAKPVGGMSVHKEENLQDPLTTALGIPLCSVRTPWIEGTGGFFVAEGDEGRRLLLVTARHAVLPPELATQEDNKHVDFFLGVGRPQNYGVSMLGPQTFDRFLDRIKCEIGRNARLASERQKWTQHAQNDVNLDPRHEQLRQNSQHQTEVIDLYEIERQNAEQKVEKLSILYNEELPKWLTMRDRLLGRIAVSPTIEFGAGTSGEGYTEDWAAIHVDPSKVDGSNFVGNVIDISKDIDHRDFVTKMPPSFKYPFDDDGLLHIRGVVSEEELRAEPTELDSRVNEPLGMTAIKRGCGTGLTVGRVNNVCSYVRTTYFSSIDKSASPWATKVSKEWAILPFDSKSGSFAGKGDSGASVIDGQGRFVGMITGGSGSSPEGEADIAYMTPMTFLLKRMSESGLRNVNIDPLNRMSS